MLFISKASSKIQGEVLERLGAKVVFPERDMAVRLGRSLVYGGFLDSVTLEGNVEVRRIRATAALVGKSIRETDIRKKYSLNIIAIEHDRHTDVEFPAEYCIQEGDILCLIGQTANIERFESSL